MTLASQVPLPVAFCGERPGSALSIALRAAASAGEIVLRPPGPVQAVVVGADDPDPVATTAAAIDARRPVLVESPTAIAAEAIESFTSGAVEGGVSVWAALRFRFETSLGWLGDCVRAGSLGLTWGTFAEATWIDSSAPIDVAIDLIDAIERATGLRPLACRAVHGEAALVASMAMTHGAIGLVSVSPRPGPRAEGGGESVELRVTGSHGTVVADLAGPTMRRTTWAGLVSSARLGDDGWARLVTAFADAVRGDRNHGLADLSTAGGLATLLTGTSSDRFGGRA